MLDDLNCAKTLADRISDLRTSAPRYAAASLGLEICRPNPKKAEFTSLRTLAVIAISFAMIAPTSSIETSGDRKHLIISV